MAVLAYPALTLFCIVVTANHYWIDGVGGLVIFALGVLIGWSLHRWNQDRLDRAFAISLADTASPSAIQTEAATTNPQPEPKDRVSPETVSRREPE